MTYFGPALDPPLGGSGRKTATLVRDHEYFIPTKFHQNPSSSSGEEAENVKSLRQTDGRTTTTDGRTDDGWCAMTIAHLSLRLRWAKNVQLSDEFQQLHAQWLSVVGLVSHSIAPDGPVICNNVYIYSLSQGLYIYANVALGYTVLHSCFHSPNHTFNFLCQKESHLHKIQFIFFLWYWFHINWK